MDDQVLRKIHDVEFTMLKNLDQYCCLHGINYSLIAGTLLGAVRHKGFIPWDDDVDIAMTRTNYSKFCETIEHFPMQGYVFSNFENDEYCTFSHGKLGKIGTVFLQDGDVEGKGRHEIWIDIFPFDKNPIDNKKCSEIIKIGRKLVLLSRANSMPTNDGWRKRIIRSIIRLYPNRRKRMNELAKRLKGLDEIIRDNYEWVSMSCLNSIKKLHFPKTLCEEYSQIEFNGYNFMVFKNFEEILKIMYGNYMQLPPESERICKHNPVRIDFGEF